MLVVIYTPALDVLLLRRADAHDDANDNANANTEADAEEFWQSVTGSRDSLDEPFGDTAIREVLEETGIDCAPGTPLAVGLRDWHLENVYDIYPRWLHRYAPGTVRNTERLWSLQVPPGLPIVLSPREHTASIWLPWRAAAERCFSPSNAEAILLLPRIVENT